MSSPERSPRLKIRRARPGDEQPLRRLEEMLRVPCGDMKKASENGFLLRLLTTDELLEMIEDNAAFLVIVAEFNGEIVGFIIAARGEESISVHSVAVSREYQGLGFGRQLHDQLLAYGADDTRFTVAIPERPVANLKAIRFFRANGWELLYSTRKGLFFWGHYELTARLPKINVSSRRRTGDLQLSQSSILLLTDGQTVALPGALAAEGVRSWSIADISLFCQPFLPPAWQAPIQREPHASLQAVSDIRRAEPCCSEIEVFDPKNSDAMWWMRTIAQNNRMVIVCDATSHLLQYLGNFVAVGAGRPLLIVRRLDLEIVLARNWPGASRYAPTACCECQNHLTYTPPKELEPNPDLMIQKAVDFCAALAMAPELDCDLLRSPKPNRLVIAKANGLGCEVFLGLNRFAPSAECKLCGSTKERAA